jgi:hypothetical protein
LLLKQKKTSESLAVYNKALEIRRAVSKATNSSEARQWEAEACYRLGLCYKQSQMPAEARKALLEGEMILLDLRSAGQLSDTSEGYRIYLPKIREALGEKGSSAGNNF